MCVVKDELDTLLAHKDIAKKICPILFFANKSDLPKALTPAQISEALELQKLTRPWNIVSAHRQGQRTVRTAAPNMPLHCSLWVASHSPSCARCVVCPVPRMR